MQDDSTVFSRILLTHSKTLSTNINITNSHSLPPTIIAYNVLDYAWDAWQTYIQQYAKTSARTLLLGINPGPHGMVQTGIPFGNVSTVKNWLGLKPKISMPTKLHPKRPIQGLSYHREEPSGLLLWKSIQSLFASPQLFFQQYFVLNYCPIAYFTNDGKNLTPDKLEKNYKTEIENLCTQHLAAYIKAFKITRIFAIGKYSEKKAKKLLETLHFSTSHDSNRKSIAIHYITHPSPLNPHHKQFSKDFESLHKKYTNTQH